MKSYDRHSFLELNLDKVVVAVVNLLLVVVVPSFVTENVERS